MISSDLPSSPSLSNEDPNEDSAAVLEESKDNGELEDLFTILGVVSVTEVLPLLLLSEPPPKDHNFFNMK